MNKMVLTTAHCRPCTSRNSYRSTQPVLNKGMRMNQLWCCQNSPYSGSIPRFKLSHLWADTDDMPSDFVSWNEWLKAIVHQENCESTLGRILTSIASPHPPVIVWTCVNRSGYMLSTNQSTHVWATDTTVLYLDIHVVITRRLGYEVDQFEFVPLLCVKDTTTPTWALESAGGQNIRTHIPSTWYCCLLPFVYGQARGRDVKRERGKRASRKRRCIMFQIIFETSWRSTMWTRKVAVDDSNNSCTCHLKLLTLEDRVYSSDLWISILLVWMSLSGYS
jgi:hypothetical protein